MPNGYTAKLANGEQDFADFLWSSARAFGPLILMRDSPSDAVIDFTKAAGSCAYYQEKLDTATAELERLQGLSEAESKAEYALYKEAEAADYDARVIERNDQRQRYTDMIGQVTDWDPPTSEHRELRTFMLEQLNRSLEWDCKGDPWGKPDNMKGWPQWVFDIREGINRDIERSEQAIEEEQERYDFRLNWLTELEASVPRPANLRPPEELNV